MRPLVFFREFILQLNVRADFCTGPGNQNLEDAWKSTIDFVCNYDFIKGILDRAAFDSERDLEEHLGSGIFETVPNLLADLDNPGNVRMWTGNLVLHRTEGLDMNFKHRMDLMFHFTVSALLRGLRDIAGKEAHPGRTQLEAF